MTSFASLRQQERRAVIPLCALMLAVFYVLVFEQLHQRSESLDAPLREAWKSLAGSLDQTNSLSLDFGSITNQIRETRQALGRLEEARKLAAPRFAVGEELRARMRGPFHNFEYEPERDKEMEELAKLASDHKVTLEPSVYYGFPLQTGETRQPELLWPALSLIDGLLTSAISCQVSVVHLLETPLSLSEAPVTNAIPGRLAEIPLQLELTGSADSVDRLLRSLPLRGEELRGAGLPELPRGKLPLLLQRLVIRKQTPEKPDEVRVWMRVAGYVAVEAP